jgi:hypothetical protein
MPHTQLAKIVEEKIRGEDCVKIDEGGTKWQNFVNILINILVLCMVRDHHSSRTA